MSKQYPEPVFAPAETTRRVLNITAKSLTIAANARYPQEDGYPVSGDTLAALKASRTTERPTERMPR